MYVINVCICAKLASTVEKKFWFIFSMLGCSGSLQGVARWLFTDHVKLAIKISRYLIAQVHCIDQYDWMFRWHDKRRSTPSSFISLVSCSCPGVLDPPAVGRRVKTNYGENTENRFDFFTSPRAGSETSTVNTKSSTIRWTSQTWVSVYLGGDRKALERGGLVHLRGAAEKHVGELCTWEWQEVEPFWVCSTESQPYLVRYKVVCNNMQTVLWGWL